MRAVVDAAYAHYVERLGKPPGPMLDDYDAVARAPLAFVMAREGNDEVIGLAVLLDRPDGWLLDNVALDPAWRGHGLGRQLMAFAERLARDAGQAGLALYTHELMHENIALYERLGYVETGRRVEHGYARVYFRKPLQGHPEPAARA